NTHKRRPTATKEKKPKPTPTPSGHFTPPGLQPPAQLRAPQPPKRRRRTWLIAALVAVVAVTAAAVTAVALMGRGEKEAPYQAQSFTGAFGTVKLDQRPRAVAALGPGDADAVLSLKVQPVVLTAPQGQMPTWEKDLAHTNPAVLPAVDPAAIAAAKPDVIIDSGDLDQATYAKLASIAPTITRPTDAGASWNWQAQLTWIGKILGKDDAAKSVIADAANQLTQVRMKHPNFTGKSITVINYTGNETTVAVRESPPTGYLQGLGFTYNSAFERTPGGPADIVVQRRSQTEYDAFKTDVVIVCRSDPAAGSGGFAGLPGWFTAASVTLVIVDNPATIAALNTGGPAATAYLNTSLVDRLAEEIR
ncbi:ABC transporter substrate-binding protein, partial [Mycobacterium talmoniae]|uniref:ABC transporter substrate-binding protein n=1 Tax=Mycobacterium talmoniae TaxID=1858794 RepID=UPI000AB99BD0